MFVTNFVASTITGSSIFVPGLSFSTFSSLVGCTITTSSLNASSINLSSLYGSTVITSTLTASTINFSTLTGSTMFVTNFVASTITGSSIFVPGLSFSTFSSLVGCTITTSSITASSINFSTLTGSTMFVTNFVASTITGSSIFVPGLSFSTFSSLVGCTITTSTISASTIFFSSMVGSSIITSSINFSSMTGSTFYSRNATLSTLIVSSITGIAFGDTGPTGPVGQVAMSAFKPTTIQNIAAATPTAVNWATVDSTQSTGITGIIYNGNGQFINTNFVTIPVLIEYTLMLDATGGGSTYISLNGTANYAQVLTTTNQITNSFTLLVPPTQSFYVYYTDNSIINIQTTSRISLTLLTAGQQGATGQTGTTGPTGPVGQVTTLSVYPTSTQSILANTPTLLLWGSTLASQTTGLMGISYAAGSFTNTTINTLPLLLQYTIFLNTTANGSIHIGINGGANAFGTMLTSANVFSGSFSILLTPGSTVGIYYTDVGPVTMQTTSQLSITLLTAGGQGATGQTGCTGPQAAAALLSYTASGSQVINSPSSLVAVTWNGSPDTLQSTGTTGLSPPSSGLFTNNTSITLSLLVEYTLSLSNTLGGYSAIGLNGSTALFGGAYNDSNAVSNSCTVLVPPGQTVGLYYMDNGATTIQSDSRITCTVLMAGQQGPTGCTGPPSIWNMSGSNISYTSGIVTASSFTASTITAGTLAGTINYNTLLGASLTASTITLSSTIVSLGQSTNQSYYGLSYGAYTNTLWGSTLNTLTSNVKQVAMGSLGQYQVAVCGASTANSVYVTQNSGQTWSTLSAATGLPLAASTLYTSGAVSATGQYGILATNGGYAYVTNNSGATYANVNPNTPYAYFKFENNATDTQGNSATTVTGSVAYVTGKVGSAISFAVNPPAGTATAYVRGAWATPSNFTVSFWFYLTSTAQQLLFSTYNTACIVYINTSGQIQYNIPGSTGNVYTTLPSINTWYNVTMIYQYNNTSTLYLNNIPIITIPGNATTGVSSGFFGIGTYDAATAQAFSGYIDDLKIYNSAIPFNPMVPMNYNYTAVSGNGQYMVATALNGGLFMSNNFGSTWSQVQSVVNQGVWTGLCLSYTGQYIAASQTAATAIVPQLTGLAANTWTVNGVNWTASTIATASFAAYGAFNNTNSSGAGLSWVGVGNAYNGGNGAYSAGTYNTVIQGGIGTKNGEWLQIQSSVPLVMYSYTFGVGNITIIPYSYYIIGSNDGITWYPLHQATFVTNPYSGANSTYVHSSWSTPCLVNYTGTQTIVGTQSGSCTTTSYSFSTNAYTYFRLSIQNIWPSPYGTTCEIEEWYINFYNPGQFYSTNYGSNWTSFNNASLNRTLAISDNGQYSIGANGQTAYIISNYLAGYSTSSYTTPTLTGINANIVAAAISGTGSCQVIVTSGTTNNLYYSMNSGVTFLSITLGSTALVSCTMSDDGSYITAANATTVYTLNYNGKGFSLAVGSSAGAVNQAQNAIALGNSAGQTNQTANSIILNASGAALNSYSQGFYVAPIAAALASSSSCYNVLGYGADNQIVQSGIAFSNSQQVFYGEWVQLQLATAVNITGYQLLTRLANNNRFAPAFALVGSTDGINWTVLDTQYAQTSFGTIYTLKSVSPVYSYFRIIFTQHSTSTYIDLGAFILYNGGNTLFSSYQNYSVVQSGNYNIMQYNAVTVCTVSWSWANTATPNAFGIAGDGTDNLVAFQPGFIATPNGYTINGNGYYFIGYRTVSSYYTPTQGTATTANTSTLSTIGNVVIGGALTATTDAIAQGIYLTPSAANSSLILQYIQKVVNTITPVPGVSPFWANTPSFSAGPAHGAGGSAYAGGVLLPNGNVVFVPNNATTIGIYNPTTTITANSFTTGPTHLAGANAYYGGVLLPNGNVVFVPHDATTIGIYNPTANTFTAGPSAGGTGAYFGGVLLPNGNVIFVPTNSTTIGIYNPTTNIFTSGPSAGGGVAYFGGVLLPNGNVVLVPYAATTIGIYNPTANTFTVGPAHGVGSAAYAGGVLLPNGNVVFVPHNATTIGIYNPTANTFTSGPAHGMGSNAYTGGVLLPNGNVVLVPLNTTKIGIYNPTTNTFTSELSANSGVYRGGLLLPNGNVVLVPSTANVGILTTNLRAPIEMCLSPYFNKF